MSELNGMQFADHGSDRASPMRRLGAGRAALRPAALRAAACSPIGVRTLFPFGFIEIIRLIQSIRLLQNIHTIQIIEAIRCFVFLFLVRGIV